MSCEEIRELLSEYLDNRLSAPQANFLDKHLESCSECRRETEALRKTVSLLGSLDEIEPSADFLRGINSKIVAREWSIRIWAWLFEPIKIKVSLEVTALIILGFLGFHLTTTPELSPPKKLPATSREPERRADSGRRDASGRASRTEESYRAAGPKTSPPAKEERADASPLAPAEQPASELRSQAPEPPVREIVTEDVRFYQERAKAFLVEMGGVVVHEQDLPGDGLLLTVEMPQSLQAEYLARLSAEAETASRKPIARDGALSAAGKVEKKAVDEIQGARAPKDEPRATLQLRILRKK
ncbi:MAG: zf-HC2 domain-containing protein [Deltaproteobacteria bacterium]|nr:zf-HC2 domain-containing protein [Deltaproteobacteria bacterium]